MRLSLLGLWTPIGIAALVVLLAVVAGIPWLSLVAGLVLLVQGTRVAYDHRGVGSRFAPWSANYQFGYSSEWYARQTFGVMLVFLSIGAFAYGLFWH
jgi:hypothetical protein